MQIIKAVLFEPVGCLAEFPGREFDEISLRLFDMQKSPSHTGSRAYWQLLDLIQKSAKQLTEPEAGLAESLELRAVEQVEVYEDVRPALAELKTMGIDLVIASSLSAAAVSRFLEKFSLEGFFSEVWNRDSAEGVQSVPVAKAIESISVRPEHVMILIDTIESLKVAKQMGANSMLIINDHDEGQRLAMHAPSGGIVSLHELPDAIRLVAEGAKLPRS